MGSSSLESRTIAGASEKGTRNCQTVLFGEASRMTGSVPTCLVLKRVTHRNRGGLPCHVLSQAGAGADAGTRGERSGQGIIPVMVGVWSRTEDT